MSTLLAVFAHPDDESLSAGGLIARHVREGGRAAAVTATWAEGSQRANELAEALTILGAEPPRLLGYADARVPESAPDRPRFCDAPLEEAVGLLVGHIREVRPDVIVTHDAHGGVTGHPDHLRTHRVTLLAARAAGAGASYAECGPPWRCRSLLLATHPHSAAETLTRIIGMRRTRHTVPDEDIALSIDVSPWLDAKVGAIVAHTTEVGRGALPGLVAGLSRAEQLELLGTEWYTRAHLRSR
jgi:N-acetyl-1-D-myo-inositol-2-amino-2-deoxy-alpha-D-glucopyranoside deacetylase